MDTVIAALLAVWERLWPFAVVDPWEQAVCVRFGRWYFVRQPGTYWRWPFGIDRYFAINVRVKTVDLADISLETADRTAVLCSLCIRFAVSDVVQARVMTEDYEASLLTDATLIASDWLNQTPYDRITVNALTAACQPRIKRMARRWGCEVEEVGVNTLVKHRVYRLLMDATA